MRSATPLRIPICLLGLAAAVVGCTNTEVPITPAPPVDAPDNPEQPKVPKAARKSMSPSPKDFNPGGSS